MRILNSLIVPKYLKGETLWAFWHFSLLQRIRKLEGGTLSRQKKFEKKVANALKKFLAKARTRTRDRCVRRKPSKVCTKKWYIHDEVCGLTEKKGKN